jgi:hypothetical protein
MMMPNPIARRVFTIGRDGVRRLEVRIYEPVEDKGDFRCDYDIVEDGKVTTSFHGMGVDTLQALISALQRVGAFIATSDAAQKRDLYWNGDNDNLGLLLPPGFGT